MKTRKLYSKPLFFLPIVICLLLNFSAAAQGKGGGEIQTTKSITTISGVKYYLHTVGKEQSLFAIAKAYGVTVNDIVVANEEAMDGIKPGQVLKIPVDKVNQSGKQPVKQPEKKSVKESEKQPEKETAKEPEKEAEKESEPAKEATEPAKTESKPEKEFIKKTFEYGIIINNETVEGTANKGLDFLIQHRFGKIVDERDLYGVFAPANIRLGLNYGITKRFSVGGGGTKNNHLYDLEWKYIILKQATKGGMPLTLTYYGNVTARTGVNANFTNQKDKYTFANRCYFFHELMLARKFNKHFSWQIAGSYTYLNFVQNSALKHSFIGLHTVVNVRLSVMSSIQLECDYNLTPDMIKDAKNKNVAAQKPNLSLGYEVSTGQHQFQIFVTTASGIVGPDIISGNSNDFTKKHNLLIGFNITRQFDFK